MAITNVRPIWLVVDSSLWMATVTNLSLWRKLNALNLLDGVGGFAFATALALMTAACLAALLSLFAWRWTLKPVITLFLVAAALGTYFMLSYNVVIDSAMMVNVLQTDLREATALFNGRMVAMVVALAGLPGWLVWRTRDVCRRACSGFAEPGLCFDGTGHRGSGGPCQFSAAFIRDA